MVELRLIDSGFMSFEIQYQPHTDFPQLITLHRSVMRERRMLHAPITQAEC
jgi:hypothetical protein